MLDDEQSVRLERPQDGLLARVQQRTRALHLEAESTGIVCDILRGRASRYGYALLLRNLLPAYQWMEEGLEGRRNAPGIGMLAQPALYRSAAIASDLRQLYGDEWSGALPALASGDRYAEKVAAAAASEGGGLIAHAYVRYMGDLSGGQALKRLLSRSLNLTPAMLSFYDFPAIVDADAFKTEYRRAIEQAALRIASSDAVVEESAEAFALNIALSLEVAAWTHGHKAD